MSGQPAVSPLACGRGPVDPLELRRALGAFATGVAIVTTWDPHRGAVGLTINSFASVSLEPPLVLWSLSRKSPSLPVFESTGHFAISVLAAQQRALSDQFARPLPDRFAGVDWYAGSGGAPVLRGSVASFECRVHQRVDGGDHLIFIGRVERFARHGGEPLLYLGGRYHRAEQLG